MMYNMTLALHLCIPGHASGMSAVHAALCWARGGTESSHVPAVLFVLTVAAVRGETQVGWCRQMFCAAVNLKIERV